MVNFDDDFKTKDTTICPSCGGMPGIHGPTPGCSDPEGCLIEEEWDEELEEYEDDDDDEVEELDFS